MKQWESEEHDDVEAHQIRQNTLARKSRAPSVAEQLAEQDEAFALQRNLKRLDQLLMQDAAEADVNEARIRYERDRRMADLKIRYYQPEPGFTRRTMRPPWATESRSVHPTPDFDGRVPSRSLANGQPAPDFDGPEAPPSGPGDPTPPPSRTCLPR
jgi:hypothetical protein